MPPRLELDFRRTPVTLVVMAIVTGLEVVCTFDESQRLHYYNAWFGLLPSLWMGEFWRPLGSALMHGNFLHATFNLYWLAVFGPPLERRFGSATMLGWIALLAYASMLPEYVIGSYHRQEPIMIVGLSGVVYGLFGMVLVGRRWQPDLAAVCDEQTMKILIGWFFLCVGLTYTGVMSVANIAHGAGFVFGVVYGLAAFDSRRRWRWISLATVATALVLSTLVACPGHYGYEYAKRRLQHEPFWRQLEEAHRAQQENHEP